MKQEQVCMILDGSQKYLSACGKESKKESVAFLEE